MKHAFVLINCDLGSEESVISQLKTLDGVKKVQGTYGIYDILAELESEKNETIRKTITEKIRKFPHVKSTTTLTATEDIEPERVMADLIPDIIPEEKKPLEPPNKEKDFDEDEEDFDDEELQNKKS